ncbi:alpha/beta fold hydrolase [Hyalangium rubrum]|uniref:Alpha/beta hydrolase n=1 Tax=Hyalangium rubrum TaxID=3103134 RepID=A0ABU5H5P0_9BACT|nr:alpha/beta hydrolase [Hyalangium sp. s54d21]MDY7228799.1 alpha/beta hydrolase [Hyalangium sp. s54d21]
MNQVISKDGTPIAYEKLGSGPALILVDGALCSRRFGPMPKLAPLLAQRFTVFVYDRRGRGDSGDTQPYAKERELEDLDALIQAAGGSAFVVGLSSGGALALEAAASGLNIQKLVAYEPPYVAQHDARHAQAHHEAQLQRLLAEGRRGHAVKYFMRDMVGAPGFMVVMMQLMRGVWKKLEAVAHTLPYDARIMGDFSIPKTRFASIKVPSLVMYGGKTDAKLKMAAEAIADIVPGARRRTLDGQTHNVNPKVLTPAVVEYFTA